MIGAILPGVLAGRASWWAPALVASLTSLLIGTCLVQAFGTDASNSEIQAVLRHEGLRPDHVSTVGVSIAVMIVPVSVIVLAAVSSAAIAATTRDRARWRLAGASPIALAVFVLTQIGVAALGGGILGAFATALVGGRLSELLNGMILPELAGIDVQAAPMALVGAVLVPLLTTLFAAVVPALRGARVPAIRAVRGEDEPRSRHGTGRWMVTGLGLVALLMTVEAVYRHPPGLDNGEALTAGLGLAVLTLGVAGLAARILVPLVVSVVSVVSRLLPVPSPLWPLARDAAVARAHISGSTVVALACGSGILGSITGMARTSEAIARALGSQEEYNLLDTYVICAVIGLLCAVSGACVLALSTGDRRREVAMLRAAGMSPWQVRAGAASEAFLLSASAALIGLAATVVSTALVPRAAAADGLPVRFVLPWVELSVSAVLTVAVLLAALVLPTHRALHASVRASLVSV
ncbi:FtsX-like permease family protein [Brachybacterium sp. 107]|uniref:FtsX-like permease family protein n=1 Tax=Brachybacterium sp. 107 TaxID=3457736 RepID=UPI0040341BD2